MNVLTLLRQTVALYPQKVAIVHGEQSLTYQELWDLASARSGEHQDPIVPIVSKKSIDFVVTSLSVWIAKKAFLPILNGTPQTRIDRILRQIDTKTPVDLAYVIFTSGSTGKPKGVMIGHRGLNNLVQSHINHFGLTSNDKTTVIASIAFDASIEEIWPKLCVGAEIHIIDDQFLLDPNLLLKVYGEKGITFSFIPTTIMEIILNSSGLQLPASIHTIHTAGQALLSRPPKHWHIRFENTYGPTENTVTTSSGRVSSDGEGRPNIGKPLDGIQVRILKDGEVCPVGSIGELFIGGESLALGYLNDEYLTREKFPEIKVNGEVQRWYATGDLCSQDEAGNLYFHNRLDSIVKVRGYRVDLLEIAECINEIQNIQNSAVIAVENSLYAFYVGNTTWKNIESHLKLNLPDYMVPCGGKQLLSLPLNSNSKVDTNALLFLFKTKDQEASQREDVTEIFNQHLPPRSFAAASKGNTQLNPRLQRILNKLLERVDGTKSFFENGGNSIQLIQFLYELRKEFNSELTIADLFEHSQLRDLNEFLTTGKKVLFKNRTTSLANMDKLKNRKKSHG